VAVGRPQNSRFSPDQELRSRPNLAATGLCYQFMSKGHLGDNFFAGEGCWLMWSSSPIFLMCVYIYTHALCWWFGQDSLLSCLFFPLWILYTLYLPAKTMQGYHQGIQDWQIGHMKGYRDDSWYLPLVEMGPAHTENLSQLAIDEFMMTWWMYE